MLGYDLKFELIKILGQREVTAEKLSNILYDVNPNTGKREYWTIEKTKRMLSDKRHHVLSVTLEQICDKLGIPINVFYTKNIKNIDDSTYNSMLTRFKDLTKKTESLQVAFDKLVAENERISYTNDMFIKLLKLVDARAMQIDKLPNSEFVDMTKFLTSLNNELTEPKKVTHKSSAKKITSNTPKK